jgi:predicted Zn-dependent protease
MRPLSRAVAAVAALLLLSGQASPEKSEPPAAKKEAPAARAPIDELGQSLSKGADRAREQMAPAVDQMKRGMTRAAAAMGSLEEAMKGCTLESRAPYDFSSLGEYYLGRALAAEHLGRLGASDLGPDHPVTRYVNQVGQLLGFAAEALGEQTVRDRLKSLPEYALPNRPRPFAGYHFLVLEREAPNAFGGPGGVVMVTTGLLRLIENEDELAAVLAHEIVHVQRGHGVELMKAYMCQQAKQEAVTSVGRDLSSAATRALSSMGAGGLMGMSDEGLLPVFGWVNERMQAVMEAGYPRGFELEADRIALRYMQVVGYDPQAMLKVFERLEKASPDQEYGATHPKFEARVRVVRPVVAAIEKQSGVSDPVALAKRQSRFRAETANLPLPAAAATAPKP